MMSVHNDQVASVLHRAVQSILSRGLNDPRVRGLISVTSVDVTDDNAQAVISVSIVPEKHGELTMHGLRHAESHIRYQVGRNVKMRRVPQFVFKLDKSLKKQAEVFHAIAKARRSESASVPVFSTSRCCTPSSISSGRSRFSNSLNSGGWYNR